MNVTFTFVSNIFLRERN